MLTFKPFHANQIIHKKCMSVTNVVRRDGESQATRIYKNENGSTNTYPPTHIVKLTLYHIPINDTPFEPHVFWPSDIAGRIKLTFCESVSLSLKTRLMTLLNMQQET